MSLKTYLRSAIAFVVISASLGLVITANVSAARIIPKPINTRQQNEINVIQVSHVNTCRTVASQCGITVARKTVSMQQCLNNAAQAWANHMAATHVLADPPAIQNLIPSKCPAYRYGTWGANSGVAHCATRHQKVCNFDTRTAAIDIYVGFRNSCGHKKNMLNDNFDSIGVASARASNGDIYMVQTFWGSTIMQETHVCDDPG